jgi:hypothetical protein
MSSQTRFIYGFIQYKSLTLNAQIRYGGINNNDKGGFENCLKVDLNYYSVFGDDKLKIVNKIELTNNIGFLTVFIPATNSYETIKFIKTL